MRELAVVGAGPAGTRFARQAARHGRDVVVFEQGRVGEPLACSGHVSTDLWAFVPDGEQASLHQNTITGARFHTRGPGSDAYQFYKDQPVSHVIDRVGLDRTLADAARAAGADVREEHTVLSVTEHPDHVAVRVRGPDGVDTHRARMVAGCDGPTSRVREEVGLPEPDEFVHGLLGFDPTPDDGTFVDVHLTAPTFFAWRIPRGDAGVEYGLAAPRGESIDRFERFTDRYDTEPDRRFSGLIPIGPPETVSTDRVFLLGDAAGQTKPFTGGGIRYGMRAADHAAATIDPHDLSTTAAYERAWRNDLATEIRLGKLLRACYSLPEPIQRLGLAAFEGEIGVHMDRPSTLLSRDQLRALVP